MKWNWKPANAAPKKPAMPAPAPPIKTKPVSLSTGRQELLIGLLCICFSFLAAVGVVYALVDSNRHQDEEVKSLQQKIDLIGSEKELVERKAMNLEERAGRELDVGQIISAAEKRYGQEEKNRREGFLWIDRKNSTYVVTLGVLNGIAKDSRLIVFDGDQPFETMKVLSAMDVVAYVEPENKRLNEFLSDYYRVAVINSP